MIAQKISVLFDAHNLKRKAGGIETYNRNLTKNLIKQGVNLTLYTNKLFRKRKNIFVPSIDKGYYRILKGFRKAIKITKPQIIHCNNFLPYPIPKNTKRIVMVHDFCFLKEKAIYTRPFWSTYLRYSLLRADHIITNSDFTRKMLLNFLGDTKAHLKTTVVHLGIDPIFHILNDKKAKDFVFKNYRIKNAFFLFPGNITQRKNLDLIVFLGEYLLSAKDKLKIVITGTRPKSKKELPNNIIFLDYVPESDLNFLYNAASAVIYPSLCEGFVLPVIEASRVKTPVISTPLPPVREVAGETILYANTKRAWIKSLEAVIEKKYPNKLINKAYRNSLRFSWGKTSQKTMDIYKKVLDLY